MTDLGRDLWAEGTVAVGRVVEAEPGPAAAELAELAELAVLAVDAEENVGTAEPEMVAASGEIGIADVRVVSITELEPRWMKESMSEETRLRASRSVARITTRRAKPI